jgi:hypothetical protein
MAACEKAGQWELAVKLFDKVKPSCDSSCYLRLPLGCLMALPCDVHFRRSTEAGQVT